MGNMPMSGMTMSEMTTMSTPTSTTDTMEPIASATFSMSSSSDMAMMGMNEMAMTFFTSTSTPLYSTAWTPNSTGQYTGTCVFLIAFATIFRALLAVRINFFQVLDIVKDKRTTGLVYPDGFDAKPTTRPWRAKEAALMASIDVVLVGTGYLLMIAVMTMNVGYFLSILAGVFLGSMLFGRFMTGSASH